MILPPSPNTRESRSVSKAPSVLRVRMLSFTAISGRCAGSRIRCGLGGAQHPVGGIAARGVGGDDLRVLGIGVFDLSVARLDLGLDVAGLQKVAADKRIHRVDEIGEVVAYD